MRVERKMWQRDPLQKLITITHLYFLPHTQPPKKNTTTLSTFNKLYLTIFPSPPPPNNALPFLTLNNVSNIWNSLPSSFTLTPTTQLYPHNFASLSRSPSRKTHSLSTLIHSSMKLLTTTNNFVPATT